MGEEFSLRALTPEKWDACAGAGRAPPRHLRRLRLGASFLHNECDPLAEIGSSRETSDPVPVCRTTFHQR